MSVVVRQAFDDQATQSHSAFAIASIAIEEMVYSMHVHLHHPCRTLIGLHSKTFDRRSHSRAPQIVKRVSCGGTIICSEYPPHIMTPNADGFQQWQINTVWCGRWEGFEVR